MAVELNHTIVVSTNKERSARFLTEILGLPAAKGWEPFMIVEMSNGISLDFIDVYSEDGVVHPQHYAFLVSETEWDEVFGRIKERGLPYWADPMHHREGELNTHDGGRGVYFEDPDGHSLEIITRPYGTG